MVFHIKKTRVLKTILQHDLIYEFMMTLTIAIHYYMDIPILVD